MAVLVNILGEAVKCGKVKSTGVFYELLKIMEDLLLRPPSQRTHPSRKLILLNLPTGYGKTRLSVVMGKATFEGFTDSFLRVIHVIPTRNLADDILRHAKAFDLEASAQYMFANPSLKTPYFLSPFVVTTLDSYSFNFLKIPVAEVKYVISRGLGHAEIPRHAIYTALNFIDEYHSFIFSEFSDTRSKGLEVLGLATTFLYFIIRHLITNSITDVVLSTATPILTPEVISEVTGISTNQIIQVSYDLSSKVGVNTYGNRIVINDSEFNNDRLNKHITTRILRMSLDDIAKKCVEVLESGNKCLIVLNTVNRVINAYNSICKLISCGEGVVTIHSRFRIKERSELINKIKTIDRKGKGIVVASPAIEVGIDFDADVLISDAAPIPSLVQRSGRLLRRIDGRPRSGVYIIVYDESLYDDRGKTYTGIYPASITSRSIDAINKVISNDVVIDWKLIFKGRVGNRISYISLIDPVISANIITKNLVNVRYLNFLTSVMSLLTTPKDVSKVKSILSSFIRYYPIVPLFIPGESIDYEGLGKVIDSYAENYISYLLPIELSDYMIYLISDILIKKPNTDEVAILIEDHEGSLDFTTVGRNELIKTFIEGYIVRGGKSFFPIAIICNNTYYNPNLGLNLSHKLING